MVTHLALRPKYAKYHPHLSELPPPAFTVSFEPLNPEGDLICAMTKLLGVGNIFV